MNEWYEHIGRQSGGFDVGHIVWERPVSQVPSPSWWASDSELIVGRSDEFGPVILKRISRHAWSWRNRDNMIKASIAAGEASIAPKVHAADAELGILLMEHLPPEWRVGRLSMFQDSGVRRAISEARRTFAGLDIQLSPRSPLIDVNQLADECRDRGITIDARITDMLDYANTFLEPLLRYRELLEMLPSQGEGTSSNIMVSPDGQVKLLGWGSAGMLSVVHDHAVLLAEATPGALQFDTYMTELAPHADSTERAVVKLIVGTDHLRWALLTRLRAKTDPDVNLDSTKYGMWRMTLAEMLLNDADVRAELEAELR